MGGGGKEADLSEGPINPKGNEYGLALTAGTTALNKPESVSVVGLEGGVDAVEMRSNRPRGVWPSALNRPAFFKSNGLSAIRPFSQKRRPLLIIFLRLPHEHPVVLPHVSHFMQVPFRTSVKFPHSEHISPS